MKKVVIADFKIQRYGGIVGYVADLLKAFRDLGWETVIAQMAPTGITQRAYDRKVEEFHTGQWEKGRNNDSQAIGMELDQVVPYWRNSYYGYFLPPEYRICVYDKDALEHWWRVVQDADIILWNFMPTRSRVWERKGIKFDFWWRFFDLPSRIKQVFLCHDGYFNVRASNISAFKDKILFIACAHMAAYYCCEEFSIPRALIPNSRYIPAGSRMPIHMKQQRRRDFFAAHVFKSMKHIDDLVAAVPYVNPQYKIDIAGTGIEYCYMTSPTKVKSKYICSRQRDPDLPIELDGKQTLWQRGEQYGMRYIGQMSCSLVDKTLEDVKFAVDPSWCEHYSKSCRTHINGFIIEAMLAGAYPILRDYRGLSKQSLSDELYDPFFENLKFICIPWDATPHQFGEALNEAMNISAAQYLKDTLHNFEVTKQCFNTLSTVQEIIRLCEGGRKLVEQELQIGQDSVNVQRITKELMTDFYGISLPLHWTQL